MNNPFRSCDLRVNDEPRGLSRTRRDARLTLEMVLDVGRKIKAPVATRIRARLRFLTVLVDLLVCVKLGLVGKSLLTLLA